MSIVVHFLELNCSCDLVSCNASQINNQGHIHVPIAPNERKVQRRPGVEALIHSSHSLL